MNGRIRILRAVTRFGEKAKREQQRQIARLSLRDDDASRRQFVAGQVESFMLACQQAPCRLGLRSLGEGVSRDERRHDMGE